MTVLMARGRLQRLLHTLWPARPDPAVFDPAADVFDDGPDDGRIEELLGEGEVESLEFAYCPVHERVVAHALHPDGAQSCWDCLTHQKGPQ